MGTATEAAEILEVGLARVHQLLKKGRLPGRKIRGRWDVDLDLVQKIVVEDRERLANARNQRLKKRAVQAYNVVARNWRPAKPLRWTSLRVAGMILHWRDQGKALNRDNLPKISEGCYRRALAYLEKVKA